MTEATIQMQTTIACGGCGASLAPDQRYCLHCGAAHAEPRVAYRQLIGSAAGVDAPTVVSAPAPVSLAAVAPVARDWTPLVALGGLAALALVLVVGVLIGKSGLDASPAAAPAPQVITVGGVAPAATDDGASPDAAGDGDGGGRASKGRARADKRLARKAAADKQTLESLESTSGADYQRKSAKLPDTVALPGEPPPKDDKAPGGGSGEETIG